jgi:hypothetical protein
VQFVLVDLHSARWRNIKASTLKRLLESTGADINAPVSIRDGKLLSSFPYDAAFAAAVLACGYRLSGGELQAALSPDAIRVLRAAGAPVNDHGNAGETALLAVVSTGIEESISLLLNAGADVNLADDRGVTPLMAAADLPPAVIERLMEAGADVNARDHGGATALHYYVRRIRNTRVGGAQLRADTTRIRVLLDAGTNSRVRDHSGLTPAE